jgi:hypothetical protein
MKATATIYNTTTVEQAKAAVSRFRAAKKGPEKGSASEPNSRQNKHSPSGVRLVARGRARSVNSLQDSSVQSRIVTGAGLQRIEPGK